MVLTLKKKMRNLRILAVDVGMGTQDIMLYDSLKAPGNNIKMVIPSRTTVLAGEISNTREDIVFFGETMGGGPIASAIIRHIKKGYRVFMTERSARTIRDDLEQVKLRGVEIIPDNKLDDLGGYRCKKIETKDVDFELIRDVFSRIGERFSFDYIGVAVQDHGYKAGKSDRVFRFEKIKEVLKRDVKLYQLGDQKLPEYFTRMRAIYRTVERYNSNIFIVDTKIAAIAGAIHGITERPVVSIDVGNGHTLVALVGEDDRVSGMFEHHTGLLDREKLEDMIERFLKGELTNQEVLDDGGHGCYVNIRDGEGCGTHVRRIVATGPNRGMLEGSRLDVESANPFGDVMMAGPVGIVDMIIKGDMEADMEA